MKYTFKIETKADSDWDHNLLKSTYATFFQSTNYLNSNSKDYFPIFIYVFDQDQNIVGQLGLRIIKTTVMYSSNFLKFFDRIISKFSTRIIWVYGPIIHSNDLKIRKNILLEIIKAINIIAKQNNVVFIEGQTPPNDFLINLDYLTLFEKKRYEKNDLISFITNLDQSKDDLWKNISKNTRGDITRAKKRNIIVKQLESKKETEEYIKLNQEWSQTKGLTITDSQKEIEQLWKNHENKIEQIFLAFKDKKLISAIRVGCFNKIAYTNFVINSYSNSTNLGGSLLTWYVLEWAKENNFKIYDFSGGPKINKNTDKISSLLFYKSKWGGKETPYYNLIKIRQKLHYKIFLILFKLLRKYHDVRGS